MNGHGGARPGNGRKPKADDLKLIEKLTPFHDEAIKKIQEGVERGEFAYLKLFMEYYYGKPKQLIDIQTPGDQTSIPIATWANKEIEITAISENDRKESDL